MGSSWAPPAGRIRRRPDGAGQALMAGAREYRVVERRAGAGVLGLLPTAGLAVALVVGGWLLGRQEAGWLRDTNTVLEQQLQAADEQLAEYQRQLGELAMAEPLGAGVQAHARRDIASLSATVAELERELRFYRAVMPRSNGRSLQIASLELQPQVDGSYRYDVLLTRHFRAEDVISGELRVDIGGAQGNQETTLSLASVSTADSYPLPFEFRYFQSLTGTLRLPQGFAPRYAEVSARSAALPKGDARRRFEWRDVDQTVAAELAAAGVPVQARLGDG